MEVAGEIKELRGKMRRGSGRPEDVVRNCVIALEILKRASLYEDSLSYHYIEMCTFYTGRRWGKRQRNSEPDSSARGNR